jgi:DNA-binding NarL/FixJ family response regulator
LQTPKGLFTFVQLIKNMKEQNSKKAFSKRELEILENLISGKTSEEIAKELFISKYTVDKHRSNMLKKTGTKNTTELLINLLKAENNQEKEKD